MRETQITLPELALLAGTRVAIGAGLGLLLADRLSEDRRRAAGWTPEDWLASARQGGGEMLRTGVDGR